LRLTGHLDDPQPVPGPGGAVGHDTPAGQAAIPAVVLSGEREGTTAMSSMGARLTCEVCGAEALVIRPGEGQIRCCDRAMTSSTSLNAQ